MKRLWALLVFSCITANAAEFTLFIPQISKDQTASADGDPIHARYGEAWVKYEQSIAKVIANVTQALDSEFNKAADAGSLDSADKWDKKKKAFLETRTVVIEVPDKPKRPTPKKQKADSPPTLEDILESAQQQSDAAVATLKKDYDALVREYTKARNLDRAKQLREEIVALDRKRNVKQPRAGTAEKPQGQENPRRTVATLSERLRGTRWINSNGRTFQWTEDGRMIHTIGELQWRQIGEDRVEVVFGPRNVDTLVFDKGLMRFVQLIGGGPDKHTGTRVAD